MHRSMTLKQRITLGLAAFLLALAVQIFLSFYQSGTVMQRLDDQMGQFNAISRFQGGVERGLTVLGDYRWEYGDADALLSGLDSAFSTTDAWLWRIDGSLETVSEEEYLPTAPCAPPIKATPPLWNSWKLPSAPATMPEPPGSTTTRSCPAAATCASTPSSC